MKKSGAGGASPGELAGTHIRAEWGADGDGIRDAIMRLETLQLRLESMIDGAVLRGGVGDDEDLCAALLEDELGRPCPRVLERRRVLGVEQLADLT